MSEKGVGGEGLIIQGVKKMKNVFLKVVIWGGVLIGFIYAGFYLWQHRYEYFFQGRDIPTVDQQKEASESDTEEGGVVDDDEGEDMDVDEETDNVVKDDGEYFVPTITKADCEQECNNRKSVAIEYNYCREICGLNEIKDNQSGEEDEGVEDCDDIDDNFEEDVCWKTKAIREKNDKYCDEIYSEELSKVCHDRVLEEIMN